MRRGDGEGSRHETDAVPVGVPRGGERTAHEHDAPFPGPPARDPPSFREVRREAAGDPLLRARFRRAPPFPPRAGARADTSRSRRGVVRDSAGTPRRPCRKACSRGRSAASPRPRGEPRRSPAPARTPPPGCARRRPTPRRSSGAAAGTIGRAIARRGPPSSPPRRRRRAPIPSPDARSHEAASATAALSRWNPPILPTRNRSRSRPGSSTAIVPSRRSLQSKVRPSSQAPHPSRRARRRTTARAAGRSRPVTSGTPPRRIPAFSAAIDASVFPSHSRWSYPTVVMTDTAGRHALVASHRPPSPVSMTAIRTPLRRNQSEADQVIFSNQVSGSPAGERRSATRKPSRSARGEIVFPSMRTRSSGAIKVRGGVQADGAQRQPAQDVVRERGGGPLAVGPGDVEGSERLLRMPGPGKRRHDPGQPGADVFRAGRSGSPDHRSPEPDR